MRKISSLQFEEKCDTTRHVMHDFIISMLKNFIEEQKETFNKVFSLISNKAIFICSDQIIELAQFVVTRELFLITKDRFKLVYGKDFTELEFDTTFNMEHYYVTIGAFTNIFIEENPIFPAAVFLHMKKSFETFEKCLHFFCFEMKVKKNLIRLVYSDSDSALQKTMQYVFK